MKRWGEWILEKRRLSESVWAGKPLIEIEGNRQAILAGCRGMVVYTDEQVSLRTVEGCITVYGRELELRDYSTDAVVLTGRLSRIEFSEGETP